MNSARSYRRIVAAIAVTPLLWMTGSIAGPMTLTIAGVGVPVVVRSFSTGATSASSGLRFQDATFAIPESAATPPLLLALAKGTHFTSATLQILAADASSVLSEWVFTNDTVTSFQVGAFATDTGVPSVNLSLLYTRVGYKVFAPDGSVAQQMCFDLNTTTQC